MKKDLVVFALICSLACTIVSPLARNVSAVESKGNSSSSSNEEWDPDYNESNVNPDRKKKYGLDGSTSNPEAETIRGADGHSPWHRPFQSSCREHRGG